MLGNVTFKNNALQYSVTQKQLLCYFYGK